MGGRGASFGKGKYKYGTEYSTILRAGRVKFVKYIKASNAKAPQETKGKRRIYVTINNQGEPTYVTFYRKGKLLAQIDLNHTHKNLEKGHVHIGNDHKNAKSRMANKFERKVIAELKRTWYNKQ